MSSIKDIKGFGSPRIPSLSLFHQENHIPAQSKVTLEAVLLMACDKQEATVKVLNSGFLLSSFLRILLQTELYQAKKGRRECFRGWCL